MAKALQPLSTFAISLIAVSAGGHFSYRRIHNALRRILLIAVFEVGCAFLLVLVVLLALKASWPVALVLASLAVGTAPATTLALVRENRAKGPFVKTLLAVVTVDSSLCILFFAVVHSLLAHYYASGDLGFGLMAGVRQALWQLMGSALLGLMVGWVTARLFENHRFHNFSTKAVAILLVAGISIRLDFSPLFTCLVFGVYLGNSSLESERQLRALDPMEPLLYTCFFTLAGVALHLDLLAQGGLICVAYLLARAAGKAMGALAGGLLSGCSKRILASIPFGFLPQAGVALGLVVILEGDPRIPTDLSLLVGSIVLAAVTLNEIVGPFFTRAALRRAREAGLDRPRLVEFLQEEFILTDLEAEDKWDALKKLTDFYARTHRVKPERKNALYASIEEREREGSTAVGQGAAIPHGRVPSGTAIQGVLAICPEGVDFDAPDGMPVKLIVLIVTPEEHEKHHIEVLASLSAMISDAHVSARLMAAEDPNEAWEVIESRESRPYNYFLEDDEDGQGKSLRAATPPSNV